MTRIKLLASLFLLPLAASCVDPTAPTIDLGKQTPEGPTTDETSDEVEVDLAALGLELTTNSDTRVAGLFTKDDATIGFDFEAVGDDLHIVVTTADGAPLIDADVLRGGGHNTRMLGGRLVVDGDGATMPTYDGDRKVETELHEMPEGTAIHSLEPALQAARVNLDLIPTLHARGTTATPYVGYGNCGAWVTDGGYATCGSWFLGWTSLVVRNCTPYWSSYLITSGMDGQAAAPAGGWQNMGPGSPPWYCSSNDHSGWWWGWNITYKWASHYYWAGWSATHVWGQSNYYGH